MSAEREHHTYRLPKRTLSRREQEVVVLLCEGYSVKQVASVLGISFYTANKHLENLMLKLEIQNRAGVVRWAVETSVGEKEI